MPHHPVLNPHKPDKVRRVCNAAAKYQGVSLNDKLMTDPDLLNSLLGIIFRFRENPVAMTADIESMFLQDFYDFYGDQILPIMLTPVSTIDMFLVLAAPQLASIMRFVKQVKTIKASIQLCQS